MWKQKTNTVSLKDLLIPEVTSVLILIPYTAGDVGVKKERDLLLSIIGEITLHRNNVIIRTYPYSDSPFIPEDDEKIRTIAEEMSVTIALNGDCAWVISKRSSLPDHYNHLIIL